MSHKLRIKKDDEVIVVAGNDRGTRGKVLKVVKKEKRVIIEGVNMRKKHTKPSQKNPQGGITEKEMPVHISNVMIYDAKEKEGSRVGALLIKDEKTGKIKSARIAKKSGDMLK